MRRISDKFESAGLKTVPEFPSAWINALVSIELTEKRSDVVGEPDSHIRVGDDSDNPDLPEIFTTQDGLGDPEGEIDSTNKTAAPVAEALNSPAGDAGVVEVAVVALVNAIIRVSRIPSANRDVVSVLPTDPISKATTLMSFEGYSQLAIMQGQREVRGMITWESIAKR
jgi:hypothetical protein